MDKNEEKKYQYAGAGIIIVSIVLMLFSSGGIANLSQNLGIQSTDSSLKILSTEPLTGSVQVIIELNVVGVQAQDIFVQDIQTMGGIIDGQIYTLDNSILTTIDASKLETLAMNPSVMRIIPNTDVWFSPQDVAVQSAYADNRYQLMNIEPMWSQGYTGTGVVVAVVDTGINSQLSCFQRDGKSIVIDSLQLYGEYVMWHGTAVASCVASQDASRKGIAYGAQLLNVEVFKPGGAADIWGVKKGWDWVAQWKQTHQNTPLVCVNSIGADPRSNPGATLLNAYASNMVNKYDIPMIVAAGNGGPGIVYCPGQSEHVLTVGAVDSNGLIASFSCSYGPKPDVVAPGVDINMVDSSGSPKTASGTSFSTPLTAGVAALVLQAHPGYSAKQVQNAIRDSAHSVQSQSAYGEGLVDAVGAVKAAPGISFGSSSGTPDLMFIALIGIGAVVFFIPAIRKRK